MSLPFIVYTHHAYVAAEAWRRCPLSLRVATVKDSGAYLADIFVPVRCIATYLEVEIAMLDGQPG